VTAPIWLRCPQAGRVAGRRDGTPGRTRWQAHSRPACSGRLQAEAAMHGYGGPRQNPAVGLARRRHGRRDQYVRRLPDAVVLVGADTAAAEGWGG
jgi:hypothetical protein